jgi:enoyl-CoA hydratase/carnithine racemase
MEILALGEFVEAREAERIGLYNKVVAAAELGAQARTLAERLAAGPAFAIQMTKTLIDRELSLDLESALQMEAEAQAICMEHPDYKEAFEAFIARRAPRFR